MIKIGLIGVGHLGAIHLRLIKELSAQYELVGIYDNDPQQLQKSSKELNCKAFSSSEELIEAVDCVDIVTPTFAHFQIAAKAIKKSKHVFIEKPVTQTAQEAEQLLALAEEAAVKVQVGHVERFNPAFRAAKKSLHHPMFIETHRLSLFNPRGTDVPVILDLMIHDIDIILSVVQSNIKKISASGVPVVSETPDIANARIEFDNGAVANLTASRISLKNMRKSRFFQKDAYISVDFLEKKTEIVHMTDLEGEAGPYDMILEMGNNKPSKKIILDQPDIQESNAIKEELKTFHDAIVQDTVPIVTLEDGRYALEVAQKIMEKLQLNGVTIKDNI